MEKSIFMERLAEMDLYTSYTETLSPNGKSVTYEVMDSFSSMVATIYMDENGKNFNFFYNDFMSDMSADEKVSFYIYFLSFFQTLNFGRDLDE